MKTIIILGRNVLLKERSKGQLKGITIGDSISYRFFDGTFHDLSLLFVEPKGAISSPRILSLTANRLNTLFNLPIVYILLSCQAYERQRLIDKDVYFIVSDKYAHLPTLVANELVRKTPKAKCLTPVAQYTLLYHLQIESLDGLSAKDMNSKLPYSYESITLGITCLSDVGLCEKVADGPKRKVVHFLFSGKELWDKSQPYLISPIDQRIYCDTLRSDEYYPICGINALAHYTWLNPDPERMIMMSQKQFRDIKASGQLIGDNLFDGEIMIESWKYPPVTLIGKVSEWVDKLSLAISLRDDSDGRVEGEVERLIKKIEWKD